MSLYIYLRNAIVQFWHLTIMRNEPISSGEAYEDFKNFPALIRVRVDGRVHFVRILWHCCYGTNYGFTVTRGGRTLSLYHSGDGSPALNDPEVQMFWRWAVTGDPMLGHCLERIAALVHSDFDNSYRRGMCEVAIGRVVRVLDGLVASSKNYRELRDYLAGVQGQFRGTYGDLNGAVLHVRLGVGGRNAEASA